VLLFVLLPPDLKVAGLVAAQACSFATGLAVCQRVVSARVGRSDGHVLRTAVRCVVAVVLPALVALALAAVVERLVGRGFLGALLALVIATPVLLGGYAVVAARLRVPEVGEAVAPVLARLRPLLPR
jgi:ABC-type Fe3+ transport system permease subunit